MYLLIFINSADKFLKAFHIDKIICAKLLIVEIDLTDEFTRIVTSVMLYGPYGEINSHSPCMSNTQNDPLKCIKHYLCNFFKKTFI